MRTTITACIRIQVSALLVRRHSRKSRVCFLFPFGFALVIMENYQVFGSFLFSIYISCFLSSSGLENGGSPY